ncbi:hypothetical protein E2K80_18895 [Rhodophyticola sp. CCM32]|uniref:hypothetical protein n=1 Tax=Rhodophyticola sp. CCM32 TaxID=2916397 RepID=UPI00107F5E08|nr:hypothetical protein [Rhodophyticola sp. CCM32]QBY02551.1 hypothetical protein E2K80_18895 [Rhodophyticola sp. CCM32]
MSCSVGLGLAIFCIGTSVHAQSEAGWTLTSERNDRFQTASLMHPNGTMEMHCGTVLGAEASLAEEVIISAENEFNLVISESLMGTSTSEFWAQRGLRAFAAGQEFELPDFLYDEMGALGWIARVPFDSVLTRRLGGGIEVVIAPMTTAPFSIDGFDLADGLQDMIDFCSSVPDTSAISVDADADLLARADAAMRQECQGDWSASPDAMHTADLTGDGIDDLVVNRGGVTCTTGILAGQGGLGCTGDMCMHHIFFRDNDTPILLGATSIEPATSQPGGIRLGLDTPSCESMGRDAGCAIKMQWTGTTFATIGIE